MSALVLAAAWVFASGSSGEAALVTSSSGDAAVVSTSAGELAATATATTTTNHSVALNAPVVGGDFASPFEPFAIDSRFFDGLPLDPTDPAALVLLSPGSTDGGDLGRSHPSISGATGFENRWYVDGFDVTDPGFGSLGPWSREYGALGWAIPHAFLERAAVTSAAPDAARDGAGGGAIDLLLPSTGAPFRARASYSLRPGALESDRRHPPEGIRPGAVAVEDAIVHASAMPFGDKVFLLAGIGFEAGTQVFRVAEGWPLAELGDETLRREHLPHVAKLVVRPVHGQEVSLLWLGDSAGGPYGLQSPETLYDSTQLDYSALNFSSELQGLRWQGSFGAATDVEAAVSRMHSSFSREISDSADRHQLFRDYRTGARSGGIGFYEHERDGERRRATLVASHSLEAAGRHRLRTGLSVEEATLRTFEDRSGDAIGSFVDENGVEHDYTTGLTYEIHEADDSSVVYRVIRGAWGDPVSRTGSHTAAAFVEDRWAPHERVSLAGALRIERMSLHGGAPNATRYTFPATVAPRGSVEWAALADRTLVIGLEGGRILTPVPLVLAERRMSGSRSVSLVDYASSNFSAANQIPDGIVPVDGDTTHFLARESAGAPFLPGTHAPYYDEVALATRWQPSPALQLDARLIHRELGAIVDDVLTYETLEEVVNESFWDADPVITNPGTDLDDQCTTPGCWVDPRRDYDALELGARGAIRTVEWLASWRVSRLSGNYEGVWITGHAGYPELPSFDFPNGSPMATDGKSGALPLDRTHVIRAAALWHAPHAIDVGAIAWARSGTARTELDGHPLYQTPTFPHRGWGRGGREPGSTSLDLRVRWMLPLASRARLGATLDVRNVFDAQTIERRDPHREFAPGSTNPDYGDPIEFTPPRSVRFTLRAEY